MMRKGKLILQPMGGLANRMRVVAVLRQVAQQAGVPFEVRWVKNSDLGAKWQDLFEASSDYVIKECVSIHGGYSHEYYSKKWYKNIPHRFWALLHGYVWLPYNIVEQMDEDTTPEGLNRLFSLWIEQLQSGKTLYISSGDYFGNNYDTSIFKPQPRLQAKIDAFFPKNKTIYGIHIRRTDNAWAIEHSPLELFENKIEEILKNEPEAIFYLASDDAEVIAHFKNRFGDAILTYDKTFGRTSVEGMQDAVVEMWLLSKTKKIFGSFFSSYSGMAARIGKIELEILEK